MASEIPGLPPDAAGIFRAAADGDERAARIVSRVADSLGTGIALLIDILNPEAVVIGSIFARQESLLRPGMEAAIAREALPGAARRCRVLPSRLGDTVGDFAALAIASQAALQE
jgi:glucokinase